MTAKITNVKTDMLQRIKQGWGTYLQSRTA